MEELPPVWSVAENILNNQLRTADKGLSTSSGVERGAKNISCYELFTQKASDLELRIGTGGGLL